MPLLQMCNVTRSLNLKDRFIRIRCHLYPVAAYVEVKRWLFALLSQAWGQNQNQDKPRHDHYFYTTKQWLKTHNTTAALFQQNTGAVLRYQ